MADRPGKDIFVAFLDPDAGRAKQEHDRLRIKLIRYFGWNGCRCPEDLADETFLRVWRRVTEGVEIHASNPDSYFYGVAANILREERERRPETAMLDDRGGRAASSRGGFDELDLKLYLEDLLSRLPSEERTLLLRYYSEDPQGLALEYGISIELLRLRIHRIKRELAAQTAHRRRRSAAESS